MAHRRRRFPRRELARSAALQRSLDRYVYVLMAKLAASAACRAHLIGPRLARWLLMSQDRAHADSFRVTHEFLAYMIGVRRVGITTAASALQRTGLIEYRRGDLRVLNRSGLEAAASSCDAADRQSYTAPRPCRRALRRPASKVVELSHGAICCPTALRPAY